MTAGQYLFIPGGARHATGSDAAEGAIFYQEADGKFDINLVHLGLIMVINLSYGLTTPPVGTALFVALKVGKISMDKIIPPLLPLLACMSVVLIFVTYVPEVYMWLPRSFGLVK